LDEGFLPAAVDGGLADAAREAGFADALDAGLEDKGLAFEAGLALKWLIQYDSAMI
jgi:hypothetical protein